MFDEIEYGELSYCLIPCSFTFGRVLEAFLGDILAGNAFTRYRLFCYLLSDSYAAKVVNRIHDDSILSASDLNT